jgi:type VI protein secretion system component VasK
MLARKLEEYGISREQYEQIRLGHQKLHPLYQKIIELSKQLTKLDETHAKELSSGTTKAVAKLRSDVSAIKEKIKSLNEEYRAIVQAQSKSKPRKLKSALRKLLRDYKGGYKAKVKKMIQHESDSDIAKIVERNSAYTRDH